MRLLMLVLLCGGCTTMPVEPPVLSYGACIKVICQIPLTDCRLRPGGCHYGD